MSRVEYEFTRSKTKKGNDCILVEGYIMREVKNSKFYRCTLKTCNARCTRTTNEKVIFTSFHNHVSTDERDKLRSETLTKTKELSLNSGKTPNEILNIINLDKDNYQRRTCLENSTYKKVVRNCRRENILKVNCNGKINEDLYKTFSGNQFIHENIFEDEKYVVMINENNLLHLMNSEVWLADGTFHVAPKEYKQLYTIHCRIFNDYFPVCYILLQDKKEATYKKAFERIYSLTLKRGPKIFICDFELGATNAFRSVFLECEIGYCLFHWGQSIWKSIQQKSLSSLYMKTPIFRNLIRIILSLPFEKESIIEEKYYMVKELVLKQFNSEYTLSFFEYIEKIYIGRKNELKKPIFAIKNWCCHERFIRYQPLTSNICEGWHRGLNDSFSSPHPEINYFINELRIRDNIQETEIIKSINGRKYNLKYDANEKYALIRQLFNNYDEHYGLTFLTAISTLYQWKLK